MNHLIKDIHINQGATLIFFIFSCITITPYTASAMLAKLTDVLPKRSMMTIKRSMSLDGNIMKEPINPKLAQILIQEQFPHWAHLPVIPVENSGWDNRTFRLGKNMILRFPSAPAYASQVTKEQKWLPLLASKLPLPIPTPLGLGKPGHGYMWDWSVYNWIDGETASSNKKVNKISLAENLADFLSALYQIETTDGPLSGKHNFYRGGKVSVYEQETLKALKILALDLDEKTYKKIWISGAETEWAPPPSLGSWGR